MSTPILMPALSPTMEEGTLAKWLVTEGEAINSGDVIAEIETDKATMEVEAVDDGKIAKILVPAGTENVQVNAPIAILLEEGESEDDIEMESLLKLANGSAPGKAPSEMPSKTSGPRNASDRASTHQGPPSAASSPLSNTKRLFASPLAKRLAEQNQLSLADISGTGPHGRIIKRDIEAAIASGGAPGRPQSVASVASLDPRLYPADSYEAIPLDGMRKVIAKRLTQSFNQEVPHFPLMIDCQLDTLLEARARINQMAPPKGEEGHYKVSVNDFIIKASALALARVPAANATYTDEAIIRHKHADIGVAVAVDGGLITPIVWKAETLGLVEISNQIKDMAARAKAKKLKPEEYQGGTFSVSNLGMFGIKSFASIINQPQGAIMSVGAGEQRAVVRDGALAIATMMSVTLTCDHRVVDGAVGAEFLSVFKQFIEEPAAMLL
ncbi:MAG: pyruvate dehydrogenase complex dihydrolipoamide acetyltransferase [bacterium]